MNHITISYLTLRKAIGYIALVFPFLLIIGGIFGGFGIDDSFSAYYWTSANVLFVGMLVTFGIFLLSYNGYDIRDKVITSIAGVAMLAVALFPMTGGSNYLFAFIGGGVTNVMHYISATITFSFLGIMSFFQFTKSGSNETTVAKGKRNRVYRVCGIVIFGAILALGVSNLIPVPEALKLYFWLEAVILWAFGVSWLVKGEALLKDK